VRPASDRDRDAVGRPRNARPRDGLGRPLDRTASGEPTIDADLKLPADELVILAQDLIDAGRPFHAHEVLEVAWKSGPAAERELWRGLAQLAVGLTHARRGNGAGAVTLLRRGAAALAGYPAAGPHGIDVGGARAAAGQLASSIERNGLAAVPPGELRIRLAAS
jgi:uncharacterized protein